MSMRLSPSRPPVPVNSRILAVSEDTSPGSAGAYLFGNPMNTHWGLEGILRATHAEAGSRRVVLPDNRFPHTDHKALGLDRLDEVRLFRAGEEFQQLPVNAIEPESIHYITGLLFTAFRAFCPPFVGFRRERRRVGITLFVGILGIKSFQTFRAQSVTEFSIGVLAHIDLDLAPIALVVFDFLAGRAYGKHSAQTLDL